MNQNNQDMLKEVNEIKEHIKYILELFTQVAANIADNEEISQQWRIEFFDNLKKDAFERLAIAFPKELENYVKSSTDLLSTYLSSKMVSDNKNNDEQVQGIL